MLHCMNAEQFEQTLRQFLRRDPFAVELLDGSVVEIDRPKLVFGGGAASFFTADYDLIEFACEEVRAIRPVAGGVAS